MWILLPKQTMPTMKNLKTRHLDSHPALLLYCRIDYLEFSISPSTFVNKDSLPIGDQRDQDSGILPRQFQCHLSQTLSKGSFYSSPSLPCCASVRHKVFKVDTEVGHCRENICVFPLPVMLHSVSIDYVVLLLCSLKKIFFQQSVLVDENCSELK